MTAPAVPAAGLRLVPDPAIPADDVIALPALLEREFLASLDRRFNSRPLTPKLARAMALEALRDATQVLVLALSAALPATAEVESVVEAVLARAE